MTAYHYGGVVCSQVGHRQYNQDSPPRARRFRLSLTTRPDRSASADSAAILEFKIATEDWEFEQIHELSYATFVEEIPQHSENSTRRLVDKFHEENTYFICLQGRRLLGMVAARGNRPFSLDYKLQDLDTYLPPERPICEIRLLSIQKVHRNGRVLQGLLTLLARDCLTRGYRLAIVSGTLREQRFYNRLGFVPFGPVAGSAKARYQPMYRLLDTVEEEWGPLFRRETTTPPAWRPVNLLPGPVDVNPKVWRAFVGAPVSHRSPAFVEALQLTRERLCSLVGSRRVEILMGSGTLANDMVAGQLSMLPGRGLVVANGEFGERLLDHASRMGLQYDALRLGWGEVIDRHTLVRSLDRQPRPSWLWAVHCETSTGVLNDLEMLRELCAQSDIQLCLDCISSIGTVPLDLRDVYLASGASGKGLAAFPGLSMVFYNHEVPPAPDALPRYLDLGLHAVGQGVPFTLSSNLLDALRESLDRFKSGRVFENVAVVSRWLRSSLRVDGYHIVAPEEHACPGVLTIALPQWVSSIVLGRRLEEQGYLLSFNSDYLLKRNWIQVCLMGEFSADSLNPLLGLLRKLAPPTNLEPSERENPS